MLQDKEQLKLYSLNEAAKAMRIGRDNLRFLIAQGQIGYILLGKTKRIPHQELVRFQTENIIRKIEPISRGKRKFEFIKEKRLKVHDGKVNFKSKELLEKIIRSDNNGNDKRERKHLAHPVV